MQSKTVKQLFWFVAIWLVSVACLTLVALAIKAAIGT